MDETTRRNMLLGTVAVAGLSAGCLSDTGSQGPDQYGAADETVELLRAVQTVVGDSPTGRPLISNGSTTVYVDPEGGDDSAAGTESEPLMTVQEAVDRVPIYLRHQYTIDLVTVPETPVRYDEDIIVPGFIGTGQAGGETGASRAGPFKNLVIRGQSGTPEAVRVGSVIFANVIGVSAAQLRDVTLTRNSPYDDEDHGLSAYGTGEVNIYQVRFTDGPTNGLLSYGAKMKASFIDFGDANVGFGVHAKRHASIMARDIDGELTRAAFNATQNSTIAIKEGNRATGAPTYRTRVGGLVHDAETGQWFGTGPQSTVAEESTTGGQANETTTETQASEVDGERGTIWYADGSGDRQEGFYGRKSDGTTRLG